MMVKMEDGLKAMKKKSEVHMIFIKKNTLKESVSPMVFCGLGENSTC